MLVDTLTSVFIMTIYKLPLYFPRSATDYYLTSTASIVNNSYDTVFAEIFVIVLISDVNFITKFKKLNN